MALSTACIKPLRACVLAAARTGLDPAEIARRLGLDAEVLSDPYARVPHTILLRAWEEIPALTGDAAFGLHAAEALGAAMFDVLDYAIAQVATVGAAVECLLRYQRLLHDDAELRLVAGGGEARLSQRLRTTPCAPRHLSELIVALWVTRIRGMTGRPFTPRRVSFQHGPPPDIEEHRRIFGAPLAFHAAENGVEFDAAFLDVPLRGADPALGALLDRQAAELLDRLPRRDDIAGRVRAHLLRKLPSELPTLEATARALGTSARSLQRALRAEGTTYQAALDEARRDLAVAHLGQAHRTVSEIAFLLGFTEVGAFTRAFRRWTGESPSAYRHRGAR